MGSLCFPVAQRCSKQLSLCSGDQRFRDFVCDLSRSETCLVKPLQSTFLDLILLSAPRNFVLIGPPPFRVPNGSLVPFCGAEVLEAALALLQRPAFFCW